MKVGTLSALSFGLFIIAGTVWFLWQKNEKISLELQPILQKKYSFFVSYDSKAEAPSNLSPSNQVSMPIQSLSIHLEADLDFTIISEDKGFYKCMVSLKPRLEASNATARSLVPSAKFAYVYFKRDGTVVQLVVPEKELQSSSPLWTDILRHAFPRLPGLPIKSSATWIAQEHDGNSGSSTTLWQLAELKADSFLVKKSYDQSSKAKKQGSAEYELSLKQSFLQRVSVKWENESKQSFGVVRSTLSLDLKLLSIDQVIQEDLLVTMESLHRESLVSEHLDNSQMRERGERINLLKTIGEDSMPSLREKVSGSDPQDREANMATYLKLKAFLIVYPKACREFMNFLLDYDRLDDRFSMVATALTASGSPEAQTVLREAIDKLSADEVKKQRLIPNLSFNHRPSAETEQFLENLAQDDTSELIRGTAHRGLGTLAQKVREVEPERAKKILDRYAAALKNSDQKDSLIENLEVIGNIGLPEQIAIVQPYLESADQAVQERAYASLRLIPSPDAYAILITALKKSLPERTREVIAEALTYQTYLDPAVLLELKSHIYREKNIAVVKHLLQSLAHNSSQSLAIDIIKQYAKDCGHPDLCGYVNSLLTAIQQS